tara:strand:- start:1067 stop:1372 length:306 start_codon:yes stop_codon:yes gene_type:complete
MKTKIIDPPSGWMYGFPKAIPNDVKDFNKWLVENGYPQRELDRFESGIPCRFWFEDDEDTEAEGHLWFGENEENKEAVKKKSLENFMKDEDIDRVVERGTD